MDWKIKTALASLGAFILTSCGFKSNDAPKEDDGALIRKSTEWTINPVELASGTFDTSDRWGTINHILGHEAATFIPQGEDHLPGTYREISPKGASYAVHKFIHKQGIPFEKDGKILRSVELENGNAVNPVYVDCPTAERTTVENSTEHYGNATIIRKNPKIEKSTVLAVDTNSVGIAKEEVSTLVKEYYKVKKMVTGEAEKSLQAGDKVEVFKNVRKPKNYVANPENLPGFGANQASAPKPVPGAVTVKEQAVVQKDGISPTYKNMENREKQVKIKWTFNYARSNLHVEK